MQQRFQKILKIFIFFLYCARSIQNDCNKEKFRNLLTEVQEEREKLSKFWKKTSNFFDRFENNFCNTDPECSYQSAKHKEPNKSEEPVYRWPSSCAESMRPDQEDGIHLLHIPQEETVHKFYAYCMKDPDKGDAWTVIFRRTGYDYRFKRVWDEYKNGFGENENYWIGLERMHAMTYFQRHELRVHIRNDYTSRTIIFPHFIVGSSKTAYELQSLAVRTGDVFQDAFIYSVGQKFSTHETNNGVRECSKYWASGWWFHAGEPDTPTELEERNPSCLEAAGTIMTKGLHWCQPFDRMYGNATSISMAIRPVKLKLTPSDGDSD